MKISRIPPTQKSPGRSTERRLSSSAAPINGMAPPGKVNDGTLFLRVDCLNVKKLYAADASVRNRTCVTSTKLGICCFAGGSIAHYCLVCISGLRGE
jgi:hypothetical protein